MVHTTLSRSAARVAAAICIITSIFALPCIGKAAELPILHLRKVATPPTLCSKLNNTSYATGWYGSSPTWYGLAGKTGDSNHNEVLVTYDNSALYVAYLAVDRSTRVVPQSTHPDLRNVDSHAVWIQTPAGRNFCIQLAVDDRYPAQPVRASGEMSAFDGKTEKLSGVQSKGWFAGNLTVQGTCIIPWSALSTSAPTSGSRWRINFVNYNQYSGSVNASTVNRQLWAPGNENQPDQWGTLAFDEAPAAPKPNVSPEATLTLHPASGSGGEVTLRAGNDTDGTNQWPSEAIVQSNWSDWDPVDYTIKEFLQYDLSKIPPGRKIISATLRNYCRGNFTANPLDLYVHVIRVANSYDPATVTFHTSPLPVENYSRTLVGAGDGGKKIDFDITDILSQAYDSGEKYVTFALAGSSGDSNNGKVFGTSFGRADYYDGQRPRLLITFGQPGVNYSSPLSLGSDQHTSVATSANKNKLTNGTFRYGDVEGIWNSTYWQDAGQAYVNSKNVQLLVKAGDVNSKTGNPAIRFLTPIGWRSIKQTTYAVSAGKTYTLSSWIKGSQPGVQADIRLTFKTSAGTDLGTVQRTYTGSGNWEQIYNTKTAPSGTAYAEAYVFVDTTSVGQYIMVSDCQLEEGSKPTSYSETMGVYYPDYPRDGGSVSNSPNLSLALSADKDTTMPGDTITYTITYQNMGGDTATSAVIACPEPANTTYIPGSATSGGAYDPTSGNMQWTIPSIPSGGTGTLVYKVTVN